jgi:hypothetical protein
MPKGPSGERRPADVIGNAVRVMRIATGEIEDTAPTKRPSRAKKSWFKRWPGTGAGTYARTALGDSCDGSRSQLNAVGNERPC